MLNNLQILIRNILTKILKWYHKKPMILLFLTILIITNSNLWVKSTIINPIIPLTKINLIKIKISKKEQEEEAKASTEILSKILTLIKVKNKVNNTKSKILAVPMTVKLENLLNNYN